MYKTEKKVVKICLYVFSLLLLGIGLYCLKESIEYINQLVDAGSFTISGNEMDVVIYCLDYSASYLVYSIILFALAKLIKYTNKDNEVNNNEDALFDRLESIEDKLDLLTNNKEVIDEDEEIIEQEKEVEMVEEDNENRLGDKELETDENEASEVQDSVEDNETNENELDNKKEE